ncbi:MAG: type II secretion system F family protein [Candidatus Babeliales bacterium]
MALYLYQAFSKDGKKVTGYLDASSVQGVRDQLAKQGLFPTAILLAPTENRQSWWQWLSTRGISVKDKILFTRQLAILLKSGVPLLQAIELLIEQFTGTLHTVLIQIKDSIKEGQSLADALKRYPNIFDSIYVQLVRAGEASGKLEVILDRLTSYLERREALARKIKDATREPIIQLIVAGIVVSGLLTYVIPQMAENFASSGKELPVSTQLLLSISGFITGHYIILIGLIIISVLSFRYWKSTPSGQLTIDRIRLRLPIIGYFTRTNAVIQFSYTLGMLIEGGVNLAEALDIVCNIIDNRVLADALREARDKIIKQGKITQYLKQTNMFPPMATYLIGTGEESGQLDTMLLTVARTYEEDLAEAADGLTAKLGPLLLIVMAVIVGFIIISIAVPMVQQGDIAGL